MVGFMDRFRKRGTRKAECGRERGSSRSQIPSSKEKVGGKMGSFFAVADGDGVVSG